MLLKHLYDFAVTRKLLDDLAFRPETPIRWLIHLNEQGGLSGNGPQETEGPRKNKGHDYSVPKTSRATNSGTVADFLVDDIGAIFCLNTRPGEPANERSAQKLAEKHRDFWRQIIQAKRETKDSRFDALLAFKESLGGNPPSFLRLDEKGTTWIVRTAGGDEKPLGSDLFTFTVVGREVEPLIADEAIREYWRNVYAAEAQTTEEGAQRGLCLVTGNTDVPLARTHTPMVTGLPKPAKGTGAGLVGFESPSFRSYGFEKSYNAPVSIAASRGYLLALQFLSKRQDHWLSLGPAWLCFWALETEQVSDLFSRLLRKPDPRTVRKFMISPWSGLERTPPDSDKFIAVTLTAAGPRIVIKDWVQLPLVEAAKHFQRWFGDLSIGPLSEASQSEVAGGVEEFAPLAISRLAGCTAPLTMKAGRLVPDYEKLQPEVAAQFYRAALEGSVPAVSLLTPILNQLHSKFVREENYQLLYDHSRFAILKLILNRNRKKTTMEIKPELTADTDDAAYNCGRLLSVFNETQKKAHEYGLKGATVSEKYFGTASTSPAYVFPYLVKLNRHHLQKIGKSSKYAGDERFLEESIFTILARLGQTEEMRRQKTAPTFPRTLDLQAQGRFALGFYQQMAADSAARQATRKNDDNKNETETE